MNHSQFEGVWTRLHAAFPRDFNHEETRSLWAGFMSRHDSTTVMGAVNNWISENRRAPSIADILEGVKASKRSVDTVVEHYCGDCSQGWLWSSLGAVSRCPNGCQPPLPSSQSTHEDQRTVNYVQVIEDARTALRNADVRAVGRAQFMADRGYDPETHRVVHGLVLAIPPVKTLKRERSRP